MLYKIGVDCGGTFTDLVAVDEEGRVQIEKTSSTPADPSIAIINGLNKLGISLADTDYFVHGSTVGINTVIQNRGAKTAIVTTKGFRDILELRRGRRVLDKLEDMYNLQMDLPQDYVGGYSPLVERTARFEVTERVNYKGDVVTPLCEEDVYRVAEEIKAQGFEAVTVCYYFAFVNAAHEQRTKEILREVLPDTPISLSSEILPIIREYERTSTTMVNSYIQPIMHKYLTNLRDKLHELGFKYGFFMMQSGGGIMSSSLAAERPVYTVDSGPAAGVTASNELGRIMGEKDIIVFDMGGTTAKVCVINNNRPDVTNEFWIDGKYFIGAPVMDMAEIGAGGGSMAWIDGAGAVHVGPQSAGADPGPVCYNRGGVNPTVTDADLVLGYINKDYFLGGEMEVDVETSRKAIKEKVADPLNMSIEEAAHGIYRMINANMLGTMRIVTVQRGHDPRDFAMMSSGGTASIHAARMAQELRIPRVICPLIPGVFSAYGLITADAAYDVFRSYVTRSNTADPEMICRIYGELKEEGVKRVAEMGFPANEIKVNYSLELRYLGQAHEVSIDIPAQLIENVKAVDVPAIVNIFHVRHKELFGYSQETAPVELITLKVTASCPNKNRKHFKIEVGDKDASAAKKGTRPVYFEEYKDFKECETYNRYLLKANNEIIGPAIVEQKDTTIVLPPNTWGWVDAYGNIIIEIDETSKECKI